MLADQRLIFQMQWNVIFEWMIRDVRCRGQKCECRNQLIAFHEAAQLPITVAVLVSLIVLYCDP